jgi:hypothetical protein
MSLSEWGRQVHYTKWFALTLVEIGVSSDNIGRVLRLVQEDLIMFDIGRGTDRAGRRATCRAECRLGWHH